jgi:hypothetical protein
MTKIDALKEIYHVRVISLFFNLLPDLGGSAFDSHSLVVGLND